MKSFTAALIAALFIISTVRLTESTVCRSLSSFKIDCNLCKCSEDGLQYSCTNYDCPATGSDEFERESLENGYVLLKPKSKSFENSAEKFDDSEFTLSRRSRGNFVPVPYLNDGISNEDNDIVSDEEPVLEHVQDVSQENDVESWEDFVKEEQNLY